MAIRDMIKKNASPHLQPGETIQAVFAAQTTNPYWSLLSYWIIIFKNAYRVVVVTDRRILVCRSGRIRMSPIHEVLRELPRSTQIGPLSGLWTRCETLGEPLFISGRFRKDVAAADAATAPPTL